MSPLRNLALAGLLAVASAWRPPLAAQRPAVALRVASRRPAPVMLAAEPLMLASEPLAVASQLGSVVQPTLLATPRMPSWLLADPLSDLVGGLSGTSLSPLLLILPITAGALVAFGIIFILVKSGEPSKPRD